VTDDGERLTEHVTAESRCRATRASSWARDGKTMRCEKPAGHVGRHEALAGFIMFPWDSEPPQLVLLRGGK